MEPVKNALYYKEESKKALIKIIHKDIQYASLNGEFTCETRLTLDNEELNQFILSQFTNDGFTAKFRKEYLVIRWDNAK